jgi:ribosome-associated heat shock protein Hsp15
MNSIQSEKSQRLDKWLKIVRIFKTRKLASEACDKRHVKVNEVTSKSAKSIHIEDDIIIRLKGKYRSFKVLGISKRSISAKLAKELYEETTESKLTPEEKELLEITIKSVKPDRPLFKGRPTKKIRRDLTKWKDSGGK